MDKHFVKLGFGPPVTDEYRAYSEAVEAMNDKPKEKLTVELLEGLRDSLRMVDVLRDCDSDCEDHGHCDGQTCRHPESWRDFAAGTSTDPALANPASWPLVSDFVAGASPHSHGHADLVAQDGWVYVDGSGGNMIWLGPDGREHLVPPPPPAPKPAPPNLLDVARKFFGGEP